MHNCVFARGGMIVARGKNLSVVLRYARTSPVNVVKIKADKHGQYAVTFYFADGATCETKWADWRVTLQWLLARRSWSIERVTFDKGLEPAIVRGPTAWSVPEIPDLFKRGTIVTVHAYQS